MSRWRIVIVLALLAAPVAALAALGAVFLWQRGWWFWAWWPLSLSFVLAYGLAWYWQRRHRLLRPLDLAPPLHWTERDREAWLLVEARAKAAAQLPGDKLTDFRFYADTAQEMALELARFYHPRAKDPLGALTIPEILAVVELAAHDLSDLVDRYLPGSHLLTINHWRTARKATDWYSRLSQAYWLVSAVFAPVQTGLRYLTSQLGMTVPWRMLQENLILWFYTAYLHRLGSYLIDLNSGRLRVGARRYRELLGGEAPSADGEQAADPAESVRRVTLTVMGQVKAGKSSLINALLGERLALTDVLPATDEVTRYELQPAGVPTRLVLLDTVGYGHAGPREDQLRATEEAARQSDLLLLVVQARNPARQADVDALGRLQQWFGSQPELRMPPVLAVVTHIDLLSPMMEWSPPYHWEEPTRPKEQQIRQAWEAVRAQLGECLAGVVPVCAAPGKVYGVEEWLLPAVAELLDDAHAVALLRCLKAEADTARVRRIFQQLLQARKEFGKLVWTGLRAGSMSAGGGERPRP